MGLFHYTFFHGTAQLSLQHFAFRLSPTQHYSDQKARLPACQLVPNVLLAWHCPLALAPPLGKKHALIMEEKPGRFESRAQINTACHSTTRHSPGQVEKRYRSTIHRTFHNYPNCRIRSSSCACGLAVLFWCFRHQ